MERRWRSLDPHLIQPQLHKPPGLSARWLPPIIRSMSDDAIRIEYNESLEPLETLLKGVERAGDFFVNGAVEIPMPKVEVDGVGVLSFPVPPAQVAALIRQATRAPYGRGEATILDESVRKVWQLPPEKVRLGGKSWAATFDGIVQQVIAGLGCAGMAVSAELYKLLVYDPGGFFLAHRDTEKAGGMFGTLVVVLPATHRGGELVIRHAGREATVDVSGAEVSEVTFAAFYADCEHEVRPITAGHRVCLVYNLIQQRGAKGQGASLLAPDYEIQTARVTALLKKELFAGSAPAKIAWLLEHQYSPDGLSFAGLKSADAARVQVLAQAAERADCAAHLGIVHIEESGSAEEIYDGGRTRGWRRYSDEDEDDDDAAGGDEFEVIEVCDWRHYVSQWRDLRDQPVGFGELPIEPGELLPAGALDDAKPDEQRLMEASGNEGASFERSYHRAALVIWPRARFAGVLLQAGVGAALPHLRERLAAGDGAASGIAGQIIAAWETATSDYRSVAKDASRSEMLQLLVELGDETLLRRFISGVVTRGFDGSENEALAAGLAVLGAKRSAKLLIALVRENMPRFHRACVHLPGCVIRELGGKLTAEWKAALREVAAVIVEALPKLQPPGDPVAHPDWQRAQKAKPVDAAMVTELLECLRALDAATLRTQAAAAIVQSAPAFDPARVIVPALTLLQEREREAFVSDADSGRLWVHAAEFLLARSEQPPAPPTDWRQPAALSCRCDDCRALQAFAVDAQTQVARFRVRQDRRQHLHRQIEQHGLDMTHVTDRQGSPQTLVCTKTRRTYQRQCAQHRADSASMHALLDAMRPLPEALAPLAARLTAAKARQPQA